MEFNEGDKVMAKEGNNYYEAKVLKKELRSVQGKKKAVPFYYIHYQGWNERYDTWTSDCQPWNSETSPNLQRAARKKGEGEKRREHSSTENPEKRQARDEPLVVLPVDLKKRLVYEAEMIQENKLVSLPKAMPVRKIVQDFLVTSLAQVEGFPTDEVSAAVVGMQDIFDRCLGKTLLYKFERKQYGNLLEKHSGQAPSEIYGAEHFLRFFVQIGSYVDPSMPELTIKLLKETSIRLLNYLLEHQDLFEDEYESASSAYIKAVASAT